MRGVTEVDVRWNGFSWAVHDDDRLPSASEVDTTELTLGPLATATVELVRHGRGTKFHTVSAQRWHGECQYTGHPGTGTDVPLLELSNTDLCRRCARSVLAALPAATHAYFRVVVLSVRAQRWTQALIAAAPAMGWLGWARWSHTNPFAQDQPFRDALAEVTGRGSPALRRQALTAWLRLAQLATTTLESAAAAAGSPGLAVHAAHAKTRLASDEQIRRESDLIDALAGTDPYYRERPGMWELAAFAWERATTEGATLDVARATMLATVEHAYNHVRVRDVTRLPAPALDGSSYRSPAHWADAEFAVLRRRFVTRWADELEQSLLAAELAARADTAQLLVLTRWPPLSDRDTDLAYLVQYPQILRFTADTARIGSPESSWASQNRDRASGAVVLCVPPFAAQHAATAARATGRYVHATDITVEPGNDAATRGAALEVAREIALYLNEDATADPDTTPTDLVLQQRQRHRAGTTYHLPHHGTGGSDPAADELALRWSNGWLAWVPGDTGEVSQTGPGTLSELRDLIARSYTRTVTALVEAGARPDTTVTEITAEVSTSTDAVVTLVPRGDDTAALAVPVHRIVAVRAG